jgi:regulator of protease activity HflC (stomatin/prohibitin superfamily)
MNSFPLVRFLATIIFASVLFSVTVSLLNTKDDIAFYSGWAVGIGTIYFTLRSFRQMFGQQAQKISQMFLVILAIASLGIGGCTRIEPGHVGIESFLSGGENGDMEVTVGPKRIWYWPLTTDVIEYPTFVQTRTWTRSVEEGNPTNEEVSFNSKEGLTITADISLSYQLNAMKADSFYAKFRSDDLNTFTGGFLRNIARDQFNAVASTYSVEQLYGDKKSEFLAKVRDAVNAQVNQYGIKIEQFGFVGAPRLPQTIINTLNAKIEATQRAMQSENELRVANAEAAKEVAVAEGRAKADVARAEGVAKANAALVQSLTPQLLEWERLKIAQKWNGVLPTVQAGGSNGMMFQLPVGN